MDLKLQSCSTLQFSSGNTTEGSTAACRNPPDPPDVPGDGVMPRPRDAR